MVCYDDEYQEEVTDNEKLLDRLLQLFQEINNEDAKAKKTQTHLIDTVEYWKMSITNQQLRDTISERVLSN